MPSDIPKPSRIPEDPGASFETRPAATHEALQHTPPAEGDLLRHTIDEQCSGAPSAHNPDRAHLTKQTIEKPSLTDSHAPYPYGDQLFLRAPLDPTAHNIPASPKPRENAILRYAREHCGQTEQGAARPIDARNAAQMSDEKEGSPVTPEAHTDSSRQLPERTLPPSGMTKPDTEQTTSGKPFDEGSEDKEATGPLGQKMVGPGQYVESTPATQSDGSSGGGKGGEDAPEVTDGEEDDHEKRDEQGGRPEDMPRASADPAAELEDLRRISAINEAGEWVRPIRDWREAVKAISNLVDRYDYEARGFPQEWQYDGAGIDLVPRVPQEDIAKLLDTTLGIGELPPPGTYNMVAADFEPRLTTEQIRQILRYHPTYPIGRAPVRHLRLHRRLSCGVVSKTMPPRVYRVIVTL